MEERFCDVGEIRLCYETFGDPDRPTVLLVMGLATQMLAWDEGFCSLLVDHGFHVVRFDNRDIGRSSRLAGRPPTVRQLLRRVAPAGAYTLADMAHDTAGLLDHLGVESVHVVGASMGGMIAQTLAARRPERVRSLVSMMSTTGNRWVGQPVVRMYPLLLGRPGPGRDAYVERTLKVFRAIGSPGFERDDAQLRELAGASYDRGVDAAGPGRQLGAIVAARDRTAELRRITAPTLVVHGSADRLIRPSGGRATARAIAGAKLLMIEGMGHDLPRGAWPQIVAAIAEHAERAEAARPGAVAA